MRNKLNQGISIKVFKGTTHVATINRQIHQDKNGHFYCNYKGATHTVTRFEYVAEHHGTKVEYQIATD